MKPTTFKEHNAVLAEDQPEYQPLPCYVGENEVITCWRPSLWERVILIFTGRIWVRQMNFKQPVQPQLIDIKSPFIRMITYPEAYMQQTNRARLAVAFWLWSIIVGLFSVRGGLRILLFVLAIILMGLSIAMYFSPTMMRQRAWNNSEGKVQEEE